MRNDTKQLALPVISLMGSDLRELAKCIDTGLADVASGRIRSFDIDRIVERGRKVIAHPAAAPPRLEDDAP
jgi:hypothetical protein